MWKSFAIVLCVVNLTLAINDLDPRPTMSPGDKTTEQVVQFELDKADTLYKIHEERLNLTFAEFYMDTAGFMLKLSDDFSARMEVTADNISKFIEAHKEVKDSCLRFYDYLTELRTNVLSKINYCIETNLTDTKDHVMKQMRHIRKRLVVKQYQVRACKLYVNIEDAESCYRDVLDALRIVAEETKKIWSDIVGTMRATAKNRQDHNLYCTELFDGYFTEALELVDREPDRCVDARILVRVPRPKYK